MKDIFSENEIIDWSVIEAYEQEDSASSWAMALAELHKLLDYVLEMQGYRGQDLEQKIINARGRFSNIKGLRSALDTYKKVFIKFNESVNLLEIQTAEKKLKQAVRDLSSRSDFTPPSSLEKFKNYLEYSLNKKKFYSFSMLFLGFTVLILVLDNNHFGQSIIHNLAQFLTSIITYFIFAGLILILFVILIIGTIFFVVRGK